MSSCSLNLRPANDRDQYSSTLLPLTPSPPQDISGLLSQLPGGGRLTFPEFCRSMEIVMAGGEGEEESGMEGQEEIVMAGGQGEQPG